LVPGQLALFSFRFRIIRSSERLGAIDRAMRRTWLRNVNWCMSWNKLFAVASTDEHWQAVVDVFLARADAVVIDVSDLREHVVWEIERAHTLGAATRVLYRADVVAARGWRRDARVVMPARVGSARTTRSHE
jgi:hypothetical protein